MTANAAPSAKPYLQIQGLVKKFGDNYAVDHIDLDIEQHEIFALLGSSGSGKSTLLRMLAGMETPNQGKIILDGQDITGLAPYERPINMMFQSYALFPHMTVEQNIAFGLKQDKMAKGEINARVEEMLRLVQMSKFAKRKPHQLSGGQQQRVALARSLAKRPKILLLDEPLGALDKKLRQQTQLELVNTLEQVGVTCIMVTHDQEEAMTMATRVAIMSEGQLQQVGTPSDVYDFPNSRFTAEFIGETNIFEGTVVDDHADIREPLVTYLERCGLRAQGVAFIETLKIFSHLANVGDCRSLVIHPASTTHFRMDDAALARAGIGPGTIRLSIGLEDAADLIDDLKRALKVAEKAA